MSKTLEELEIELVKLGVQTECLRKDLDRLQKDLDDREARLRSAEDSAGKFAEWKGVILGSITVVTLLVFAWLGYTNVYAIPSSVDAKVKEAAPEIMEKMDKLVATAMKDADKVSRSAETATALLAAWQDSSPTFRNLTIRGKLAITNKADEETAALFTDETGTHLRLEAGSNSASVSLSTLQNGNAALAIIDKSRLARVYLHVENATREGPETTPGVGFVEVQGRPNANGDFGPRAQLTGGVDRGGYLTMWNKSGGDPKTDGHPK